MVEELIPLLQETYSEIVLCDLFGHSHFDMSVNKNTFAGMDLAEAFVPGFKDGAAKDMVELNAHFNFKVIAFMGDLFPGRDESTADTQKYEKWVPIEGAAERFANCASPPVVVRISHVCTWFRTRILRGVAGYVRKAADILNGIAKCAPKPQTPAPPRRTRSLPDP